mgnify:CR=1 FL=1
MKGSTKVEFEVGGLPMFLETGVLAKQADAAVTCGIEENIVFSAVTSAQEAREGCDFFPLQVEYREKFYAAGRFPGGYIKREARPSEKEVLTMRVTDRPIRTLFPSNFHREVQINNMLMSCDERRDTDILSVNASSAALTLSDLPFNGPIGAVRIARNEGEWIINPTHEQLAASDLDLTYCGAKDRVMMIEGTANEVPEAEFIEAMQTAHQEVEKIIDAQLKLRAELGLPEKVYAPEATDSTLLDKARELAGEKFIELMKIAGKQERQDAVSGLKAELKEQMLAAFEEMSDEAYFHAFHDLEVETVRRNVIEHNTRIGGRGFLELRELDAQVGILPRTHGSAIFGRGETQTLCTVTLGTKKETQGLDAVTGGVSEKEFLLHYNFPPYSVGEVGRLGMTSRREIGHGNLAERSIVPVLPEDFPYAVRVVSEVMGSNGSSSMASACGGALALVDAGGPLKAPVAGISVGLFTDDQGASVQVIDILGVEDHCGDMDFKVAGTKEGVTSLQMDIKITGITYEIMEKALEQAKGGRDYILNEMNKEISEARTELGPYTPRSETIKVKRDNIGEIIGKGGSTIKDIIEKSGAKIDISDNGNVKIAGTNNESIEAAKELINSIIEEPEVGQVYEGKVVKIMEFGAFVNFFGKRDGLVHISQLSKERVEKVTDVVNEGDIVKVKVLGFDKGKVKLSIKDTEE